ncbi:MAG: ATP-binding protein [Bdellovibrionia bacterium]
MKKLKNINPTVHPLPTFQDSVQEALDRVGTLLKTLFETADDAIFLMDDLLFLDCNPATLGIFGCTSQKQIVGKTPLFFSPPLQPDGAPSADKAAQYIKSALDGVSQHFEWRHWKLNRTPFDVDVNLNRCLIGGLPFLVAVVRDVTARKQAESDRKRFADRLFQEKQFSDRLIESLPGVFYLFDSNLGMIRWNRNFEVALGYSAEDLRGRRLGDALASDEKRTEMIALARKMLNDREPNMFIAETEIVRKDGKIVPYLCSAVLVDFPSEPLLLGVGIDITERKLAAMERDRLINELQAANSAKENFLAILSHELRNPLAAIQAGVGLLRFSKNLEESRLLRIVKAVERSVSIQARLINDLLDMSNITRGSLSLQTACIQVSDFVIPGLHSCRSEAERTGVSLVEKIEPGIWVNADSIRMQQVIINLIENGIKFTPKGGQVKISVLKKFPMVIITVEDTGTGIDPQLLPELFEMFRQGQTKGKKTPGLGIGLAIVKSIVSLHGGRVSAESAGPGCGSRFTVELPLCEAPETPGHKEVQNRTRDRCKLLLIEDMADTREFLADALVQLGYQVFAVESGEEALQSLACQPVDVILADIGLPGMDGYEFLRQARRRPTAAKSLAFPLSGYGQEKDRRQSREVGYIEHFVKPLNIEQIDRRIQLWLKQIPVH